MEASVSALAKSLAVANLSTGSSDIAFDNAFDKSAPADGTADVRSGGLSVNRIAITRCGVVAVNGADPATIS